MGVGGDLTFVYYGMAGGYLLEVVFRWPVVAPAGFFIRKMLNKQLAELHGVLLARG